MDNGIPVPKQIEQELSQTRLFTYDRFLMIESDPKIEKRVKQKVMKITDVVQKEITAFF